MKEQNNETKRRIGLSTILGVALLFLSVIMIKSAFSQFYASQIVGGIINVAGGLLFFGVSMMLLSDLCRYLRKKETTEEDSTDGY